MNELPLPKYNYPVGTIIEIDGRPYKPPVNPVPGRLMLMDCHTGQPFLIPDGQGGTAMPTEEDFDRLLRDERAMVVFPDHVVASRLLAAKAEFDMSDLLAIDPGLRKVQAQIETLDANGVPNGVKAITAGLEKHWTEELRAEFGEPDNPHTIKRWRSERGKPGAREPKLLVRLNGKVPRAPYLHEHVEEIMQKHALDTEQNKRPIKSGYALAATELHDVNLGRSALYPQPDAPHPIPSYDTFRRKCIAVRGSETVGIKDGKEMVESAMRGGGRPLTAGRILEKVIVDHTPLSAFVVIDPERDIVAGRPWMTFAIDVHSRAVIAWVITFKPPSYWTVCEVLRRMNLPKRPPPQDAARYRILTRICGKPAEVLLDNAAEFTGHGLEDAAKSASFSVTFCPVKAPRYRAIGERVNGTVERKMLENLPGASMTIEYNRRTGHDGADLACVTMNEIEALANKALAEYHTEIHEGIAMQPALAFQKSANRHGIDVMGDTRRFRLDTLDVQLNVRITKSGARVFNGLRYFCHQGVPRLIDNNLRFEPRRQARVDASITTKIKFDPENIAVIHAWDKTTRSYVELRCQDETYADGMPLWFHRELVDMKKAEATAPPEKTAKPRSRRAAQAADGDIPGPSLRRLSDNDDEVAPKGFNTEAERLEARARRIAAVRAVGPGARHRERLTLARLYETPRLRQITGNIVHLDTDYAQAVSLDDFIAHDASSQTALDAEILADRPPDPRRKERTGRGDRRDAATGTRPGKVRAGTAGRPTADDEDFLKPSRRRGAAA
ncbi:DDE-type integrase/transposase/recombinase [Sphingomonas sp. MAH-20]|uniref:DDE-type integrase/transposase/recombinase n=1 Tax=Sphingomonas horti TaxID=2682842 RepID=A0A6I4J3U6_9SPHN|nr:DDE-type integrase/transposase/recombinase [Sphingomonas sp. CGMCC 1.13658]MBA2919297.1 transposase family protein [Sphingomonas sp. CGMCC 1.13658]MVO79330.1 DDE-type integrase/transposase/recombinase [Sphingomonas horti]